jgi:hypothetical protein
MRLSTYFLSSIPTSSVGRVDTYWTHSSKRKSSSHTTIEECSLPDLIALHLPPKLLVTVPQQPHCCYYLGAATIHHATGIIHRLQIRPTPKNDVADLTSKKMTATVCTKQAAQHHDIDDVAPTRHKAQSIIDCSNIWHSKPPMRSKTSHR